MKTTATIRDVAALAEVSPSVVSKVLSGRMGGTRVAGDTRSRILSAAEQLAYVPNINAKRLYTRRAGSIGMLVPSHDCTRESAFDVARYIMRGVERKLEALDLSLLMLFQTESFWRTRRYERLFRERMIDGLLVWGSRENEPVWQELVDSRLPVVFVTSIPKVDREVNFVRYDYYGSTARAVRYLLKRGARQLLMLSADVPISTIREEEEAFAQVLAEAAESGAGGRIIRCQDFHQLEAYHRVLTCLREGTPFDGIVGGCGHLVGAQAALERYPERQVILAGIDGGDPDISRGYSLDNDADVKVGEEAINALLQLIDAPESLIQRTVTEVADQTGNSQGMKYAMVMDINEQ